MSLTAADREVVYTVAQLIGGVKRLLEERVGRLWVVGELSDVHIARSGHIYFSLKDETHRVRCALFRSAARGLEFEPEDGLEVLLYGDVSVYEARGDLQIVARRLEPRGRGAAQLAFEQLRRRLEADGLFDPARKRPLPELPARIGVVTSPTGAAIHDILEVTGRRFPAIPIVIAATRVQGDGAEDEIAAALDALSARGDVDLILLARGGGSLEDLRCFNTEVVARAVVRATVPVLCGVGHEVDVTIADLAADLRAPTPSAAAELAVPDVAGL
ncbi:MAG: exodeoxyribonuclease VII large subunit, partial [Gaiellales bacterium]